MLPRRGCPRMVAPSPLLHAFGAACSTHPRADVGEQEQTEAEDSGVDNSNNSSRVPPLPYPHLFVKGDAASPSVPPSVPPSSPGGKAATGPIQGRSAGRGTLLSARAPLSRRSTSLGVRSVPWGVMTAHNRTRAGCRGPSKRCCPIPTPSRLTMPRGLWWS